LAQVEVDVGAAQPGAADLYDHVEGALDLWLLDLIHRWPLGVAVNPHCLHRRITSAWLDGGLP
jgi:hypothetical protein